MQNDLKDFLDAKYSQYCRPNFIEFDPICIPHNYSLKQDIEITAFFAAILAWGQRKTIINKCNDLFRLIDNKPYDFVLNHSDSDLKPLERFVHRTFNATDLLYFIHFFKYYYQENESLEAAFVKELKLTDTNIEVGLNNFEQLFFDSEFAPQRTRKHIASPKKKSACKRINMFLRWMVRTDREGVDFGIWQQIKPSQLVCPCDVHVDRVARKLGLITRKQTDWQTAVELTQTLKKFDAADPVKYDFALFGLGVEEKF
jgi:uncharacterized protein (TIGR02757 family)